MIVITDSNILFSALKSPSGIVAKILTHKSNIQFYAPNYLIEEIKRHSSKISDNKKDVLARLEVLLERIEIMTLIPFPRKKFFKL